MMRDEVLAQWATKNGEYLFYGKVYVSNGEFDINMARIRYMIFKKELELALTAIMYGDRGFFCHYPWLIDAPIYIQFNSIYPEFNTVEYYGTPRRYLKSAANMEASKTQV